MRRRIYCSRCGTTTLMEMPAGWCPVCGNDRITLAPDRARIGRAAAMALWWHLRRTHDTQLAKECTDCGAPVPREGPPGVMTCDIREVSSWLRAWAQAVDESLDCGHMAGSEGDDGTGG